MTMNNYDYSNMKIKKTISLKQVTFANVAKMLQVIYLFYQVIYSAIMPQRRPCTILEEEDLFFLSFGGFVPGMLRH